MEINIYCSLNDSKVSSVGVGGRLRPTISGDDSLVAATTGTKIKTFSRVRKTESLLFGICYVLLYLMVRIQKDSYIVGSWNGDILQYKR